MRVLAGHSVRRGQDFIFKICLPNEAKRWSGAEAENNANGIVRVYVVYVAMTSSLEPNPSGHYGRTMKVSLVVINPAFFLHVSLLL